jgi:hypothetical protein
VRPGLTATHLSGISIGTVPPQLFQVSDVLIVVSAATLGMVGAKMIDLTVKNTLRASSRHTPCLPSTWPRCFTWASEGA